MTMNSFTTTLLVLTVVLVLLPTETYAFGAGDIPDFAYLNGKAFRHGDIEDILTELAKTAGHASGGGGLLGSIAQSVLGAAVGGVGAKFSKEDVKRVYFGNWLRDYSQCMDIAGLSKLSADTLVLIVSVLGFLTFGFATEEFEVTADRLGVYLPVEHIDNPKGYAEKEGDARQFHPKLRPPVNPEELEIDERTGMKNYMATENRGWDTSTALIRRVFRSCIEHGRRAKGCEGADLWEAYRLLGTGLHTMEDLLAHSNWCELALRKMGYNDVFCHVGDNVLINTPNGQTHPLVTGTFGGADFLHSLLGEATDHLSQASVVDLSKKMDDAQSDSNSFGNLSALLKKLPIGGSGADSKMDQASSMQEQAKAYRFDPNNVAPPEVREQLWQLLKWRDSIYKDIIEKIELIPGLSDLIDGLTNALNAVVYTILAPYISPILKQVTDVLMEGSKAVIDTEDQYQVFDNPDASDPSHSLLSKDHFALILNEPAGKIALVVVRNSVKLLVDAWFNDNVNPDQVIDQILEAFHHPWYATGRSRIQQEMFQTMQDWVNSLENVEETMQALSKESVRAGTNKRQGSDDDMKQSDQIYGGRVSHSSGQYGVGNTGYGSSQPSAEYGSSEGDGSSDGRYGSSGGYGGAAAAVAGTAAGYGAVSEEYGRSSGRAAGGYGGASAEYGSVGSNEYGSTGGYGSSETRTYGQSEDRYGSSTSSYGAGYEEPKRTTYGDSEEPRREHHKKHRKEYESEYEGRQQQHATYGRQEEPSYGRRSDEYGGGNESQFGRSEQPSYGGEAQSYYGGGGREREEDPRASRTTYGETATYGEDEREGSRRHHGYGEEAAGREGYRGGGYRSTEYEAPPPPPPREEYGDSGLGRRGGRVEGYGGGEYGGGQTGYERPAVGAGYGEGYAPSYGQEGYGGGGEYGRAAETGYGRSEHRGGEGRGYGGGEYGGEGRRQEEARYGQAGETFGVEGLSLGGGEEEPPRHHGKHHHKREEDY